jgi:hypothetical protein
MNALAVEHRKATGHEAHGLDGGNKLCQHGRGVRALQRDQRARLVDLEADA